MPLAASMIQIWYHCRPNREMHGTLLWIWIFIRNHLAD